MNTPMIPTLFSADMQRKLSLQEKFISSLKEGENYKTGELEEILVFSQKLDTKDQSVIYYLDEDGNTYLFWDNGSGSAKYFDKISVKR